MLSIKHEGFLESLSTNLSRSKSENSFTDITLISDEAESFHAHKFVLASCSSFFGKLPCDMYDTSDLGNKEAKRKEESDSRETLEPMKKQKIYCYEKIHLSDVSEIRPKIEELSEKVEGVWRCKFCGKTLTAGSKKQELGAHIETHFEGLSFQCDLCDKITNNRNSLRKHKYRSHKQNK